MSRKKEKLLTEKEVSDLFGVNRVTLWRWRKAGILVPVKMGRTVRYKQSAINKAIK